MEWARDLADWPNAAASRQIRHGPHKWHIQEFGPQAAPLIVMLHGAGASTHSWRGIIDLLKGDYRIVALDLPGHGFTRVGARGRASLNAMTEDIAALLASQHWRPKALLAHSAGTAIALQLAEAQDPPTQVIGINPALARFPGIAGWLFPVLAKMLALNPFVPWFFTQGANPISRARRLLDSTGSTLTDQDIAFYARLISDRTHVDGALQMMAQWDVDALIDRLPDIAVPCLFLTGARDGAVSPDVADRAAAAMPQARTIRLEGLGHLAHEEDPARIAAEIRKVLEDPQ